MEDESIKSGDSKVSKQDSAPSYSEIASGKKTSSVKRASLMALIEPATELKGTGLPLNYRRVMTCQLVHPQAPSAANLISRLLKLIRKRANPHTSSILKELMQL